MEEAHMVDLEQSLRIRRTLKRRQHRTKFVLRTRCKRVPPTCAEMTPSAKGPEQIVPDI
jgi:hypothetical protein